MASLIPHQPPLGGPAERLDEVFEALALGPAMRPQVYARAAHTPTLRAPHLALGR